jgi:magnesium chelatase family protein
MDLVVPVTPLAADELAAAGPGEASAVVRERVALARRRQRARLADTCWTRNAEVPAAGDAIRRLCPLEGEAERLLLGLAQRRNLSMRAVHRMRRVARTIADLDPACDPQAAIGVEAVALAARLRSPPTAFV